MDKQGWSVTLLADSVAAQAKLRGPIWRPRNVNSNRDILPSNTRLMLIKR
jgi:hypothetical protein